VLVVEAEVEQVAALLQLVKSVKPQQEAPEATAQMALVVVRQAMPDMVELVLPQRVEVAEEETMSLVVEQVAVAVAQPMVEAEEVEQETTILPQLLKLMVDTVDYMVVEAVAD